MLTYACAGTGGHSEYVRIWNDEIDVNATWEGYGGDWHNITFGEAFTLKANETYNYAIRTIRRFIIRIGWKWIRGILCVRSLWM